MNEAEPMSDEQKACLSKLTWATRELAAAAAAYSVWQRGGKTAVPYQCRYCQKWHLARG